MRCEDNVLHCPQRMIRRQRLDLVDVEARPSDLARLQCRRQVRQIDDYPATHIDEVSAPFHLSQPLAVGSVVLAFPFRRGGVGHADVGAVAEGA